MANENPVAGTPDPATTLSPKILLSTLAAAAAPLITAAILEQTGMTIDVSLVQAVIFSGVTALATLVAGWWKKDPLRRAPAPGVTITSTTAVVGELQNPAKLGEHLAEHHGHVNPSTPGGGTV